jgi:hypothetical protein
MYTFLIVVLIAVNFFWFFTYLKQKRLNRLLLHLLYNFPNKEGVLEHMYFQDVLNIKKDMNSMINADIDTTALEKALKNKD